MGNTPINPREVADESGLELEDVMKLQRSYDVLTTQHATHHHQHLNLQQFLSKFSPNQHALATLIFQAMDIHQHGEIDFRDFCLSIAALSNHENPKNRIGFAFRLYDKDQKGFIDKADLCRIVVVFQHSSIRVLNALGVPNAELQADDVAAAKLLESMDTKHDGKVTPEEFEAFCLKTPEIFKQVETAFQSLKKAALMDWEAQGADVSNMPKPSFLPNDCIIQ